jgi:hypothetical protein
VVGRDWIGNIQSHPTIEKHPKIEYLHSQKMGGKRGIYLQSRGSALTACIVAITLVAVFPAAFGTYIMCVCVVCVSVSVRACVCACVSVSLSMCVCYVCLWV